MMNTNANTIPVSTTTIHQGRGQHRASKKIKVDDQLKTKSENRRRQRTSKSVKYGRYRAETRKVNLTWFIGFILVAVAAFSGSYGILIGMMTPEPVVMLQTHEKIIKSDYFMPVIPDECRTALDQADKGFNIAESKPGVKTHNVGKKLQTSQPIPKTVKFYDQLQKQVYAQDQKYSASRVACLNSPLTPTKLSQTVFDDVNFK